jgi:hypothetical protein
MDANTIYIIVMTTLLVLRIAASFIGDEDPM